MHKLLNLCIWCVSLITDKLRQRCVIVALLISLTFCSVSLADEPQKGVDDRQKVPPDDVLSTLLSEDDRPTQASVNGLVIGEFIIKGNDKTQPITIMREVALDIGDIPTQKQALADAQAILNLELFESVELEMVGNNMVITVEEKWYILPIPRLSANVSGDSSYGLSVKWYNFRGLNDTLDFAVYQSRHSDDELDDSLTYRIRYSAPFFLNTDTDLNIGVRHDEDANDDDEFGAYNSERSEFSLGGSRWITRYGPQHGWRHSLGMRWQHVKFDRSVPGLQDGQAVSLSAGIEYRNQEFQLYSESGIRLSYEIETDLGFLGNDYNFTRQRLDVEWKQPGPIRHHTLSLRGQLGIANGGRLGTDAYSIGGKSTLRGYKSDDLDGNVYYALRAEYLAPVFKSQSVRAFVFLDVADIYADLDDINSSNPAASAGLGFRWRITEIVDVEIELGFGIPFGGDDEPQAFGGKV